MYLVQLARVCRLPEDLGAEDLEEELSRQKEIKVKIPMDLYLKLHQHKIINGELLKDVVQDALDGYLAELESDADDSSDTEVPAEPDA